MSAVEIRTRDCKVPGCTAEAEAASGPYALLCARHKRDKQNEVAPKLRENLEVARSAPRSSSAPGSATEATRELLRLAADIDRATAKLEKAKETYRSALEERNAAREAHRAALRALLGDDAPKETT